MFFGNIGFEASNYGSFDSIEPILLNLQTLAVRDMLDSWQSAVFTAWLGICLHVPLCPSHLVLYHIISI